MSEYLPENIAVIWQKNGQAVHSVFTTSPPVKNSDGTFTSTSVLKVPLNEWASGAVYSCQVSHSTTSSNIRKDIRAESAIPLEPRVHLLPPTPEEIQTAGIAILTCMITGFYPNDITVWWQKDGAAFYSNSTSFPTTFQQDMTFDTRSLLYVSAADWKKDATYSCVVSHPPSKSIVKANIRTPREVCRVVDINAITKKPSFEEIWTLRTATIVCEVVYADLQNVKVSWRVNGSRRMNGVETRGPEWRGSKSVIVSKLKVSVEEWNSGTEYLCFVEDRDLPTPLAIATKKNKVTEMRRPKAYLLYPSAEEMQTEEAATLICLVTGFYPEDIYVGWMANDTLLDSGYSIQFNSNEEDGSNSVTSKLKISAEDWEKGTTYNCLVGHPSLKTNLVRSINKSQGKPTLVNVSVVLTDSFKSCV